MLTPLLLLVASCWTLSGVWDGAEALLVAPLLDGCDCGDAAGAGRLLLVGRERLRSRGGGRVVG